MTGDCAKCVGNSKVEQWFLRENAVGCSLKVLERNYLG